jgi:single-strand DNA-binding protein
MATTLNKVFLVGGLTRDPELRRIPSGTAVTTLGLAIDDSFQTRSGEKTERTLYVDVDVWDRAAENCVQYLAKGRSVLVEGRLQMDQWTDKETGKKRSQIKVRAERIQFLGSPKRDEGGPAPQGGGSHASAPSAPYGGGSYGGPSGGNNPAPYVDPLGQGGDAEEEIPF